MNARMPDLSQILHNIWCDPVQTENAARPFPDDYISDQFPLNAKIHQCTEIIPVCQFLRKLQVIGFSQQADDWECGLITQRRRIAKTQNLPLRPLNTA